MISEDYFKAYAGHPEITDEIMANAEALVGKVNDLLAYAEADGWKPETNPSTGTLVSGQKNGGFRPSDTAVGAAKSAHKRGQAMDIYDPQRKLASWCMSNLDRLRDIGLHMEDTRWTPTWVHLQSVSPSSGKLVFVPSPSPPMVKEPPQWA